MIKVEILTTIVTLWLLMSCGLLVSPTCAMPTKSLSFEIYESSLAQNVKLKPTPHPIRFGTLPKRSGHPPPSGPSFGTNAPPPLVLPN
ncbi:hypothetical protein Bca101_057290 [Brassica carinata]